MKKLIIASDQVGYHLKSFIIALVKERGLSIEDGGTYSPDKVVDYPDYIRPAAHAVADGEYDGGIVICGTGLGASIAANKVPGIRCVLCTDVFTARMGRAHNDANVLALGAWVVTPQRAVGIVDEWLGTSFEGGRHIPRLAKLDEDFSGLNSEISQENPIDWVGSGFGVALTLQPSNFSPILFGGCFEKGLEIVSKSGFDYIELSVRNPEDIIPEQLKNMLIKYGLSLSALATGQGCVMDELCLASLDDEKRITAIQRIKRIIDLAKYFKTPVIIGGVRGRLTDDMTNRENHKRITIETIKECVRYAVQNGIETLIEPINRYETNFINTLGDGIQLIEEINEPSFKLLADTFHMNIEEADLSASLIASKEYIGYIHFADSNRLAPGQGHIDFKKILFTLQHNKYKGKITAEILPLPDDVTAAKQTARYLSSLIAYPKINSTKGRF